MAKQNHITSDDVNKLLSEPSAEMREMTARKVAEYFSAARLGESEKRIVGDIFRAMVKDAEVRVRKALAETLKENPELPREVAVALARDVHEVALPVIEFSTVLSDADLIDIIATSDEARQVAVANRATVSAAVADALVDTDNARVVTALVANDGADIREETCARVLDRFSDNEQVANSMALRSALPLTVAERLVTMVTDSIKLQLAEKHHLPADLTADILIESRERATVGLLGKGTKRQDMLGLIDHLHDEGRLTPTLIIRALCMGDVGFFEAALAKRAGIPVTNAWQLVHYKDEAALPRLFKKAGMPEGLLEVARIGTAVAEELRTTAGDDRDVFRKLMIERILTRIADEGTLDGENIDYLIGKLGKRAA